MGLLSRRTQAERLGSFMQAPAEPLAKQHLRICNAYPFTEGIHVVVGKVRVTEKPIQYQACEEFKPVLNAGEKVLFKISETDVGAFTVTDVPKSDSVLLLVMSRRDATTTTVMFESHVFARLATSQLAVIDAYRGAAKSAPRILDKRASEAPRNEELRYNTVVAVNPGKYEVALMTPDDVKVAKTELVAAPNECYVVLRCGVESSSKGRSYPQSLVVFPKSKSSTLEKGAAAARRVAVAVLTAVVGALAAA